MQIYKNAYSVANKKILNFSVASRLCQHYKYDYTGFQYIQNDNVLL